MKPEARSQRSEAWPALVCFALQEEAAPFQNIAADRPGIHILTTGVGRANAEKSLRGFLAGNSTKHVFTCGFAGGLNPELPLGAVIFDTDDAPLSKELAATGVKPAKFFCADRVAITVAEKKHLRAETGADAVEMESGAIQAICGELGIPCATVRVITDTANEDLPLDFNQLAKADLSVDYGKLALALAQAPGRIPALVRLRKNTNLAAQRLAAVLEKVIWRR